MTAHAAPASSFQGYSAAIVKLESEAAECGLQNDERYSSYLTDRLTAAGAGPDTSAPAIAELGLSATLFAGLGGKCVVIGSLTFEVPLEVSDVEMVGVATKREAIVAAFEENWVAGAAHDRAEVTNFLSPMRPSAAATARIDILLQRSPSDERKVKKVAGAGLRPPLAATAILKAFEGK